MRIGEIVKTICFVVISLQVLVHALLCNSLHHVLSVLSLHRSFLFNFDPVELVHLIAHSHVLEAFLLEIIHPLLSFRVSLSLSLLHVPFHIFSSVLIRFLVFEKRAFTSVHLL